MAWGYGEINEGRGSNTGYRDPVVSEGSKEVQQRNGVKDDLDLELWRACAGPQVCMPNIGDLVYYFPQGHLEQAEPETDEVYAHFTLIPEPQKDGYAKEETAKSLSPRQRSYSFCKILTASDTRLHGGFSVLRRHAEECLLPLDMSQESPNQELVAKDLYGIEWRFRHTFRGQPRRHLLTSGWSGFITAKRLIAGDAFIFISGENGDLRVGASRTLQQQATSSSVISSHSMLLGVLATASHAIAAGTIFSVFYKPRTRPSEFIIRYDRYVGSMRNSDFIGMRFECEDAQEKRFSGTVISIEDIDPIRWPGSTWRCLKVQWDETSLITRPDRVHLGKLSQLVPPLC